jgi:hypothetical protein
MDYIDRLLHKKLAKHFLAMITRCPLFKKILVRSWFAMLINTILLRTLKFLERGQDEPSGCAAFCERSQWIVPSFELEWRANFIKYIFDKQNNNRSVRQYSMATNIEIILRNRETKSYEKSSWPSSLDGWMRDCIISIPFDLFSQSLLNFMLFKRGEIVSVIQILNF